MKGIEKLTHITEDQRKLLILSAKQYKRFARIYFEVLEVTPDSVSVKIKQLEGPAEKYLSAKDLTQRAQEVFEGMIPVDWKFSVRAVPFKFLQVVDVDYINSRKEALGLTDVDLSRLLDVRPENLSKILSDNRGLTKLGKAAFYYLFKYLEK